MLRAIETFHMPGDRMIVKGELVQDDDEAVKGREELFEKAAEEPKQRRAGKQAKAE